MNRHTIAAKKMRAELLEKLGKWCVLCGEDDEEKLQFDHKFGRDYVPNKLSYRHRMTVYKREEAKGLIRVLCEDCNLKVRKKNDNGQFVPTAADVPLTENIPF